MWLMGKEASKKYFDLKIVFGDSYDERICEDGTGKIAVYEEMTGCGSANMYWHIKTQNIIT